MTIKTGTYVGVGSEVFKSCVDFLYRTNSYVWVTFEPAQKGGVGRINFWCIVVFSKTEPWPKSSALSNKTNKTNKTAPYRNA